MAKQHYASAFRNNLSHFWIFSLLLLYKQWTQAKNKLSLYYLLLAFFITDADTLQCQVAPNYNVLFIIADDMNNRADFMGWPEAATPNLQKLIERSMLFKHAYNQYPLCNPSRTSVLTGWRPDKTGVFDNITQPRSVLSPDVIFLPEYYRQNGYRTERYGKIMHGPFESDIIWDYAEPTPLFLKNPDNLPDNGILYDYPPGEWWVTNDSVFFDGNMTRDLVKRLREPLTQPFFYALGVTGTHDVFKPYLRYWNMTGDSSVKELLPMNKNGETDSSFTGNGSMNITLPLTPVNDRTDVPSVAFPVQLVKENDEWKRTIHAYDAEVTQMDAQIGLLLDEMDRQNLWANTIVVFFGDNGQHLGEHEGLWRKETLFDESIHIPLIIYVPGKTAGVCNALVELEDIFPTLLELCSLPPVSNTGGSGLVPLLDNPALPWKRAVFAQVKRRNEATMFLSAQTQQFAYNTWGVHGEELYDHFADPYEYTNLAKNPAYNSVLQEMRTILAEGWTKSLPPVYPLLTFYRDFDKDGFGNLNDTLKAYAPLPGYVANSNDCNDNNAMVYPGAKEICNGFDDDCDNITDEGKPVPAITPLSNLDICETGYVILKTNAGANYRYQWKRNGTDIAGATRRRYTATATGEYAVQVSNLTGCTSLSNNILVTSSCSMIADNSLIAAADQTPAIFPESSQGQVTLTYICSKLQVSHVLVKNGTGKNKDSKPFKAMEDKNTLQLNQSSVASGRY